MANPWSQGVVKVERLLYKLLKKLRFRAVQSGSVHPTSKLESGTLFYHATMDRHSFCGYDCDIQHADIGGFSSIANRVVIGGGRHPMEWVGMSPVFYAGRDSVKAKFSEHTRESVKRVVIGHDVWIGHSAIVLPGVEVGNGAVIGAGAIVTRSVPPYAIVAGNPARVLRYRFDEDTVRRLEATRWWAWPEEALRSLGHLSNDVPAFLEAAEKRPAPSAVDVA
jgi:acetyltransferase-like isoleucine patch superfamily enzyme